MSNVDELFEGIQRNLEACAKYACPLESQCVLGKITVQGVVDPFDLQPFGMSYTWECDKVCPFIEEDALRSQVFEDAYEVTVNELDIDS